MSLEKILGEELFNQVKEKIGDKKIMIDDGNFIPKNRFDEVINQKNELKEQVTNLNETLKNNSIEFEKLKTSADGNKELETKLQEYQDKLNQTQEGFNKTLQNKEIEWQQREANNKKSYAVREKLLLEHIKGNDYMDLVMNKIDLEKITEENGKFNGLDEVVGGIKEGFPDLFNKPQIIGTGVSNGNASPFDSNQLKALSEKAKGGSYNDRIAYMKAKQEMASNSEE